MNLIFYFSHQYFKIHTFTQLGTVSVVPFFKRKHNRTHVRANRVMVADRKGPVGVAPFALLNLGNRY